MSTVYVITHLEGVGIIDNKWQCRQECKELLKTVELYRKSLPRLQFVYAKRKVSTKLFYAPKQGKKKLDRSMRQSIGVVTPSLASQISSRMRKW